MFVLLCGEGERPPTRPADFSARRVAIARGGAPRRGAGRAVTCAAAGAVECGMWEGHVG